MVDRAGKADDGTAKDGGKQNGEQIVGSPMDEIGNPLDRFGSRGSAQQGHVEERGDDDDGVKARDTKEEEDRREDIGRDGGQATDREGGAKEKEDGKEEDRQHVRRRRSSRQAGATEQDAQVDMAEERRDAAILGQVATLEDIERLLRSFLEDKRKANEEGSGAQSLFKQRDAISSYQALMDRKELPPPHPGTHPGLAGPRRTALTGGGRQAGGPGAPRAIRNASTVKVPQQEQQQQRSTADGDQPSLGQVESRSTTQSGHQQPQRPSFYGPSRFPGGSVMPAQGSKPGTRSISAIGSEGGGNLEPLTEERVRSSHSSDGTTASIASAVNSLRQAEDEKEDEESDSVLPRPNVLWRIRWQMREFLAELVASTFLITIGTSVNCQVSLSQGLNSSQGGIYQSQNWAWGIAVLCTVHIAGGISGAHVNPAITIALALLRHFPPSLVPVYLLAQLLGSFIGAALTYAIYVPSIEAYQGHGIRTITGDRETASMFVTKPDQYATPATSFTNELVASAIFGMVVFAIGDDSNSPPGDGMSGLILGLTVTMIGMSLGWQTGYAINAARDLGPRLFLSCVGYESAIWTHNDYWWIYGPIVGTVVGAIIGCTVYDLCIFVGDESPLNANREGGTTLWHLSRLQRRLLPWRTEKAKGLDESEETV